MKLLKNSFVGLSLLVGVVGCASQPESTETVVQEPLYAPPTPTQAYSLPARKEYYEEFALLAFEQYLNIINQHAIPERGPESSRTLDVCGRKGRSIDFIYLYDLRNRSPEHFKECFRSIEQYFQFDRRTRPGGKNWTTMENFHKALPAIREAFGIDPGHNLPTKDALKHPIK